MTRKHAKSSAINCFHSFSWFFLLHFDIFDMSSPSVGVSRHVFSSCWETSSSGVIYYPTPLIRTAGLVPHSSALCFSLPPSETISSHIMSFQKLWPGQQSDLLLSS